MANGQSEMDWEDSSLGSTSFARTERRVAPGTCNIVEVDIYFNLNATFNTNQRPHSEGVTCTPNSAAEAQDLRNTATHEGGHGLGFDHTCDPNDPADPTCGIWLGSPASVMYPSSCAQDIAVPTSRFPDLGRQSRILEGDHYVMRQRHPAGPAGTNHSISVLTGTYSGFSWRWSAWPDQGLGGPDDSVTYLHACPGGKIYDIRNDPPTTNLRAYIWSLGAWGSSSTVTTRFYLECVNPSNCGVTNPATALGLGSQSVASAVDEVPTVVNRTNYALPIGTTAGIYAGQLFWLVAEITNADWDTTDNTIRSARKVQVWDLDQGCVNGVPPPAL